MRRTGPRLQIRFQARKVSSPIVAALRKDAVTELPSTMSKAQERPTLARREREDDVRVAPLGMSGEAVPADKIRFVERDDANVEDNRALVEPELRDASHRRLGFDV